jgi:hypothetical protein
MRSPGVRSPWLPALVALAGCVGEPLPPPPTIVPPPAVEAPDAPPPAPRAPTVHDVAPNVDALRDELARDGERLPEPLEGAPPTFVLPGDRLDPQRACLLRLKRVTLGGEFDAFDDEDLVVFAEARGVRFELGAGSLDLPAEGVETFDLPGHDWIEVPVSPAFELTVSIVELDARREELVVRAVARLDTASLPDGTSPVVLPLGTVRGTTWTMLGAGRPFAVDGASVELAVLSTPRAGRGDSAGRASQGIQATLGPLLDAAPPRTAAGARTLVRMLVARSSEAMSVARAEPDPGARAVITELAAEARRVAVLAAAAVIEPLPAFPRALLSLDEAAARCAREDPRRRDLVGGCALLAKEPAQPHDLARVGRAHDQAARLLRDAAALCAEESTKAGPPQDLNRLISALGPVERLLRRTRAGLEARDLLDRAWVVLQSRLRSALR